MPYARYTHFVRIGKHALWVLAASIVGVMLWVASDNTGSGGSRLVFSQFAQEVGEAVQDVMQKPHFQGVDENKRPFTVIADQATQKDKQTVVLTRLRAQMENPEGKSLTLTAPHGEINLETKQMQLSGGVQGEYAQDYVFTTDHAQADFGAGTASGDSTVTGKGKMGTLVADGFTIIDRGRVIRFNGSVRMKLYR